ncbi:hypothetical protein J7E62_04480 [Variovorax paradoxus]|nr:hypothetical protein [Variovorax paradoxus]
MSEASKPFAFSQFVPGFDFLQSLAGGAAGSASAVPGMPSLSSWVAPTLSVEEVDKRIQELKTVQYWLEQNGHALKATIQALEVQKMTLSTLRGMNVRMEDLANAFTRPATAPASAPHAAPPAPAPEPEPEDEAEDEPEDIETAAPRSNGRSKTSAPGAASADAAGGVVDPLQWWGALTQQFQQIASSALQDASQLKVPAMAQPLADAVGNAMDAASGKPARKTAPAGKKKAPAAAKKSTAPARKRARER